jgi:hypothetical protein
MSVPLEVGTNFMGMIGVESIMGAPAGDFLLEPVFSRMIDHDIYGKGEYICAKKSRKRGSGH